MLCGVQLSRMCTEQLAHVQAGMVSSLNARCSIVASMNPAGQYDASRSLLVNTGLPAPLLSRFDLVMLLLDSHDSQQCVPSICGDCPG